MFLAPLVALLMPSPVAVTLPAVAYVRADPDGVGTGFVIDHEKRWLLTCRHVVGSRKGAEVFFPWRRNGSLETDREEYLSHRSELKRLGLLVNGKVLRTSDALDLALIELDSLPPGTPAVPISDGQLTSGDRVVGIGNRADLETLWNVSPGEVRQAGRLADGYEWLGERLATDAPTVLLQLPVEQGDSGGPVVNARGELAAVVSGLRRRATLAAIGIRVDAVRAFIDRAPAVGVQETGHPKKQPLNAVVWVHPTATNTRAAGVVVDAKRRLVLTSAIGEVGERVGVAFPLVRDGRVVGERDAYADPVALHLVKCWHVGTVLRRDTARDLALIRLDTIPPDTPGVELSEIAPDIGEAVTAVSHPTGTEFVFAHNSGSVKQHARLTFTRDGYKVPATVYQLPAQRTSPGGPIFNTAGKLIGVQSAKDGPELVGYAVRVNEVRAFLGRAQLLIVVAPALDLWAEVNEFTKLAAWHRLANGDADTAGSLYPNCVPALLRTKQFDRVLTLRTQNREALIRRSELWMKKHEPKKAAADLQRILDVTPADADARLRFASATASVGDDEKASEEFRRVLILEPNQKTEVFTAIFTHADELEQKAESRAADWLRLALARINEVVKDETVATTLQRAAMSTDVKEQLQELGTVRPK